MAIPVPLTSKYDSFTLIQSTIIGYDVPLTVGFIVCLKDARSRVELRPIANKNAVLKDRAGPVRIFNYTYNDARDVRGEVTVIGERPHSFKISIAKKQKNTRRLISNFFMTKAAGMTTEGASGLDVAFCIACSRFIYGTKWEFGDPQDPKPKISLRTAEISTHHIYKTPRKKGWLGQVSVYDSKEGMEQDKPADSRKFNVIMTDLCDCTKD